MTEQRVRMCVHCAHGRDGVCVTGWTGVCETADRGTCVCVCVRGHVCRRVRTCARVSEAGVYRRVCGCARAGPRVQACAHVCACVSEAGACGAGVWGAGPGFPPDKHLCHRSTPGPGGRRVCRGRQSSVVRVPGAEGPVQPVLTLCF